VAIFSESSGLVQSGTVGTVTVVALELDGCRSWTEVRSCSANKLNPGNYTAIPVFTRGATNSNLTLVDSSSNSCFVTELADCEFVRYAAGDLQAVVRGREGQARDAERVANVERGENAEISSVTSGRETSSSNGTEDKALEFHY